LNPEELERLRENSRIRLDRDGRFWHEDVLVEHPKVAAFFHRGLARAPDGRATLTVGHTWCYVEVEDTLYLVTSAALTADGEQLASGLVRLDDGSEEPLGLGHGFCSVDAEERLYVRVKQDREWARMLPAAQRALEPYLVAAGSGYAVRTVEEDVSVERYPGGGSSTFKPA